MAKPEVRIAAIQIMLAVGGAAVLVRAGYLQLYRGQGYSHLADSLRTVPKVLEAPRGVIYDRTGTALATSLERYRIDISGVQVNRVDELVRVYRADLGAKVEGLRQRLRAKKDYYSHGPFTAGQVRRLREFKGVHLRPVYRREYPSGPLARPLIGSLSADSGKGVSGLEKFLDSLLTGRPGETVLLRDRQGRTYESPGRVRRDPVPGHDVVLTIDQELQEIAEGALSAVFRDASPRRGDIVFLDPKSGEILAAASREVTPDGGVAASASYFINSFEPGSTAKPFTAAALLELKRVDSQTSVSGENGRWRMPAAGGRTREIEDEHPARGPITLARAIQVSSNIGMAKFGSKLRPEEHYDFLRGFGFGSPSGVDFAAEGSGILPALPHRWRQGDQAPSVAMGYAFQVTPVQLAAAYGALANDGLLLAPAVVKEVRRKDGTVLYRHRPTTVRRVVSSAVAAKVRNYLAMSASDSGTGGRAQVKGGVLGKTGTARLVENRRYVNRRAASFAGIFPAKDPQLVVTVRIEDPKGADFGGLVAAPLVRRMLSQALAARRTALDRVRLADDRIATPVRPRADAGDTGSRVRAHVTIPIGTVGARPAALREVPDVAGQTVRAAAAALHRRGFRVRVDGDPAGRVASTTPSGGDSLAAGKLVTVVARREGSH